MPQARLSHSGSTQPRHITAVDPGCQARGRRSGQQHQTVVPPISKGRVEHDSWPQPAAEVPKQEYVNPEVLLWSALMRKVLKTELDHCMWRENRCCLSMKGNYAAVVVKCSQAGWRAITHPEERTRREENRGPEAGCRDGQEDVLAIALPPWDVLALKQQNVSEWWLPADDSAGSPMAPLEAWQAASVSCHVCRISLC